MPQKQLKLYIYTYIHQQCLPLNRDRYKSTHTHTHQLARIPATMNCGDVLKSSGANSFKNRGVLTQRSVCKHCVQVGDSSCRRVWAPPLPSACLLAHSLCPIALLYFFHSFFWLRPRLINVSFLSASAAVVGPL